MESSESRCSHENNRKPIPSARVRRSDVPPQVRRSSTGKRTDSSSLGFSDGETDVETPPSAVHSAPPVFNLPPQPFPEKFRTQSANDEVWRKRAAYGPKPTITRSPNVSQHRNLGESYQETRHGDGEAYKSPVVKDAGILRRQNSEGGEAALKVPTRMKLKEQRMEPDVPARSARKNRAPRETQCRSLGESADVAKGEARNLFLGTINEGDFKGTATWARKEQGVDAQRSVTDWPANKDPQVGMFFGVRWGKLCSRFFE